MKYVVTFEKRDEVRWLGHLDILRTFERAIRRAGLPIAFTTGFNPREKIAFASALPVGVTGGAEIATIELAEPIAPDRLVVDLNDKLPAGIQLTAAHAIPDAGSRDLLNSYDRAEYEVRCRCPMGLSAAAVQGAIDEILAADELVVEREKEGRVRKVNVRPFIYALRVGAIENERLDLDMVLAVGGDGSVKATEVVAAVAARVDGIAPRRAHRRRLLPS